MRIILSNLADLKLKYYVNAIDKEISGIGLVEKRGEDLYVSDVFLLKQRVTGAETFLDRKAVNEFINEKMDIPDFPLENLKLWWHSHNTMGVFWSGKDDETCDNLDLDSKEDNWYLSIVCNKAGQRLARIDIFQPFRATIEDVSISTGEDKDLEEMIKKEVTELVTSDAQSAPSAPVIYDGRNNIISGGTPKEDEVPEKQEEQQTFYNHDLSYTHHKHKHHHGRH